MEEEEGLFDKINEVEMERDIELAIKGHRVPEIRPMEEFILSCDELFQNIEKFKH
ncbi:hypothetical protein PFJ87_04g00270 [Encephalitozoon hellem]|uniref:Uncharacterized protein n=1 Tax=Encephalitozoon hellem TaxID=27973 RepID=A0ABY8CHK3_ENCHE|nr:hypothetical protein PFJ87_04g00270 [Encephalitozoon hellem]